MCLHGAIAMVIVYNILKYTDKCFKYLFSFILCVIFFNLHSFVASASINTSLTKKAMFYFGSHVDYNLNIHAAEFRQLIASAPTCCPMYKNAFGNGFSLGLLLEKPISNNILTSLILGSRISYSVLDAAFAEEANIGNVELRESVPPYSVISTTGASAIYNLRSHLSIINLNLYASNKIFNKLIGTAGLNLGVLTSATFDQWEELNKPGGIVYSDSGTRIRSKTTGLDIPNLKKMQIGASIGLGYELPINNYSYLTPEIKYNFTFTNLSNVNWNTNYLQIGASIKFPIYKDEFVPVEKIIYERDTTTKKRFDIKSSYIELVESVRTGQTVYEKYILYQPAQAFLALDMKIYGVDNNNQRQENPQITIEEFLSSESFPMLPNIYFPDGSYDLSKTRIKLLTSENTSEFDIKNTEANALDIYYNSLNVFAQRMLENPDLKVTIAGYSSGEGKDKNTPNIETSRANAIKNYLVNIWNISESRLIVVEKSISTFRTNLKFKEDADSENRRVELLPTNSDYVSALPLFRPIQLTHIERTANPPQIEFETKITAEAGVDMYKLSLLQDNKELRNFSGRASEDKILWTISEMPIPLLEAPIEANLLAKDLIEQTKEISQKINIEQVTIQKKKERIEGDWKIEKYSLVLFGHDKFDVSSVDRQLLAEIKSSITPNSKITISGFADRTGQNQYNKSLAQSRCEEVKKILEVEHANIRAIGSDKLLFNNNLPEGRALSRTVQIEVRTPIQ